jgi:hypothetical protein
MCMLRVFFNLSNLFETRLLKLKKKNFSCLKYFLASHLECCFRDETEVMCEKDLLGL